MYAIKQALSYIKEALLSPEPRHVKRRFWDDLRPPDSGHMPGNKIPGAVVLGYLRDAGFVVYRHTHSDTVNKGGNRQSRHLYAACLSDPANPPFGHAGLSGAETA